MSKRCDMLSQYICDLYGVFVQSQGFHWNVEGPAFFHLHDFFEEVYGTLYEDIDEVAERIRALGGYPPMTLSEMAKHATIAERSGAMTATSMVEACASQLSSLIEAGQHVIRICDEECDPVTGDLMTALIYKLDKYRWQATSYMKSI